VSRIDSFLAREVPGMDATPSLDYSALLDTYVQKRQISTRLSNEFVRVLERDDVNEAGRRLGILHRDTLVLDSHDEICVLMDFAIRHLYHDGKNAIRRYPQSAGRSLNSEELDVVARMAVSRYRILDIEGVEPGVGLMVTDRLRRESGLLVDRSLSVTASLGRILAGNVVEWEGYWATTGASLPMTSRIWAKLERPVFKRFGKLGPKYRNLDPLKEADLAAWSVRACLDAGMAQRVAYR
jgi:hypothetical protein